MGPPGDLAERIAEHGRAAACGGRRRSTLSGELEASGAEVPPDEDGAHRVWARHVCRLAADAEAGPLAEIKPTYLRRPDAELWRERDRGTTSGR